MLKKIESLDMLKNEKVLNSMHISYMFSQLRFSFFLFYSFMLFKIVVLWLKILQYNYKLFN